MSWRAAKSSIVSIATGEPVGEPETARCCKMSENAETGIGSSTAPTTCRRPLGASELIIASQSSFTLTVLMVSGHALAAVHVAAREPADADALSHLESLGIWTYRRDPTDDFVAESRRVLRDAPVIVEDREVRVTQTTVFDGHFNVLGPER